MNPLILFTAVATAACCQTPLAKWAGELHHAQAVTAVDTEVSAERRGSFTRMVEAAAEGRWDDAAKIAPSAGYVAKTERSGSNEYLLLVEAIDKLVQPTVVFARTWVRDLVVEAPHTAFESDTAGQAMELLVASGGRAAMLEGANRCASTVNTRCGTGTTVVCSPDHKTAQPYVVTDVAHNPDSLFSVASSVFEERWPKSIIVQLHQMQTDQTNAWVVVSDGTRQKDAKANPLGACIRDQVRAALGRERATSCQDPADDAVAYRALCARDNVQGRRINGSNDACAEPSQASPGRFLHIEQMWRADPNEQPLTHVTTAVVHCIRPADASSRDRDQ